MNADPSFHRDRENQLIEHVERLLSDDRLRIDTTLGRRPVSAFTPDVKRSDGAVELRRLMSEMNVPDRELESRLPVGRVVDVTLTRPKMFLLTETIGRLRVVCVSPVRALLKGEIPASMSASELRQLISAQPASAGKPTTLVIGSTSGFTLEAHELADRRADRTVILVEPNAVGGWSTTGPTETKSLSDLFDPEAEQEKRQRIRGRIDAGQSQLAMAGIASDRLAAEVSLPVQLVEAEVKAYAKEHAGLSAKRLDGRVVLFREGSGLSAASAGSSRDPGGSSMPGSNE